MLVIWNQKNLLILFLNYRKLINYSQDKKTDAEVFDKGLIFDEVIYMK